jgi:hypothetical protein
MLVLVDLAFRFVFLNLEENFSSLFILGNMHLK